MRQLFLILWDSRDASPVSFAKRRRLKMPYDHAPEYGKKYGYAVLTAAFFAVAASKIRQTIRL